MLRRLGFEAAAGSADMIRLLERIGKLFVKTELCALLIVVVWPL
jgi:hypothetical protein